MDLLVSSDINMCYFVLMFCMHQILFNPVLPLKRMQLPRLDVTVVPMLVTLNEHTCVDRL